MLERSWIIILRWVCYYCLLCELHHKWWKLLHVWDEAGGVLHRNNRYIIDDRDWWYPGSFYNHKLTLLLTWYVISRPTKSMMKLCIGSQTPTASTLKFENRIIKCHSTPYDGRYHLSMLVLKSIHVSKRGSCQKCDVSQEQYSMKQKEVNVLKCTNMRLVDINLRHLIGIYKW